MSRHCAMEMGKDILAIAPDGVPCAFQLKDVGGKQLTLGKWRNDLEQQIVSLVHNQIVHPSIPTRIPHRSYIVINGELSEEVANSIDQFNRGLRGRPKLVTFVRGQLLHRFKTLGSDFWPTEISIEFKLLLELILTDGRENLPKSKLAELLEAALRLEAKVAEESPALEARRLTGMAILCSYAISSFQKRDNHVAEFEAWTMLFAYTLSFAEKFRILEKSWRPVAQLASTSMFNALGRLCDEARNRRKLFEGDVFADRPVFRVRITHLAGLLGLYGLWRRMLGSEMDANDEFIRKFSFERTNQMFLWGEACVPQFLAAYFYRRSVDASISTELMLATLIRGICTRNDPRGKKGLPSPYYDAEQVLLDLLGDEENRMKDNFAGSSYSLEAFFHLIVRCNLKQTAKLLWPDVSRISYSEFRPGRPWRFFQWRSKMGLTTQRLHRSREEWPILVAEAADDRGKDLPPIIRPFPMECLAFLLVYPHRLTASAVRWLDSQIWTLERQSGTKL